MCIHQKNGNLLWMTRQVDYASGAPVSLHQPHHYERQEFVSGGRESPLVVYHEEPFSQQQPSVSLPVDTYIQVCCRQLPRALVILGVNFSVQHVGQYRCGIPSAPRRSRLEVETKIFY